MQNLKAGLILGFVILLPFFGKAQDDLLKMLEDEQEETIEYTFATFKGTRVVNLQSPEIPGKGVLQYMFIHRFGAFNNDYFYNFLGLNTAEVRLQLDYSFFKWLNVGLGYSSSTPRSYDGFLKYKLLRQSTGAKKMPFTLTGYSALYYTSERFNDGLPHNESERLSFVNELIFARKFSPNFSMEIVPTHVHFNVVNRASEANDILVIGAAARLKITPQVAITTEYIHQLNPLETSLSDVWPEFNDVTNTNPLSIGVDIETGGHVFQLFFTNSRGVADPYVITQTTGSWLEGDIHFGFNISRVFTIQRPEEFED